MLKITPTTVSFKSNDNLRINPQKMDVSLLPPVPPKLNQDTFVGKPKAAKSFGQIFGAVLGAVFGIKAAEISPINIEELEIIRAQFKDLFMREDISIDDTKSMIKRYQEIEKIKDKSEYTKAMYDEAKKNFGFGEVEIPLTIEVGKRSKNGETMGSSKVMMDGISISPNAKRDKISNYVHHELRHMKQHYYAANYSLRDYLKALYHCNIEKNGLKLSEEALEPLIQDSASRIESRWGKMSKDNIPDEKIEFAQKCIAAEREYRDGHENADVYDESFLEKDARFAGSLIEDVLKRVKNKKIKE